MGRSASAQTERFDVQPFRPSPNPRDLVIVPQTQPISHLSFTLGAYLDFALDPLVILDLAKNRERVAEVVRNRLTLDLMAGLGLFDWFEVGLVLPIVLFQQSSNFNGVSASGLGDLSLLTKVPILRRLPYAPGVGVAVALRVNFPTGSTEAFASDGSYSFNPTGIVDYRFKNGFLITGQFGAFLRPTRRFLDLTLGPTLTAALGAEAPLVRRWGLGAVAGGYVNVPLAMLSAEPAQIPAEAMVGLRWYSSSGVTFTTGFNFGINCGFGIPTFRFFLSAIWTPSITKEYEAIQNFKKPPEDRDGDGVLDRMDACPDVPGPVEFKGCPVVDTDKDGFPDMIDRCPKLPGTYWGCPRVFESQNQIQVMERIHFATDQDVILPESFVVLEEVAQLIKAHPEWQEIRVDGHTDFRASDAYNLDLSQRRAGSVQRYLTSQGVEPSRLKARGFGRGCPIEDNRTEQGMALNRRVEFTLMRVGGRATPESTLPCQKPRVSGGM